MRNKKNFLDRISNNGILLVLISILLLKTIFYILVQSELAFVGFGQGSDADYYHSYAIRDTDILVNIWPAILRYLNNFGLYSRHIISYLLFFSSLFFIPILVAKLTDLNFNKDQKYYLYILLLCLTYPAIYFYVFDVYRDVFMVIVFLLSCLIVKKLVKSKSILPFMFLLFLSIIFGFFLLLLRPYLGYAFLLSIFLYKIRFTKKRLVFLGFLYFLALVIANYIGALDAITKYRTVFEELEGGSNLGLDFSNPIMFFPTFILSMLGQLFGLYITNPLAIIIFLIETMPFLFMLNYVIKNIKLADNFIRFLIIFFVLYASVWLIGNDNLGTAVRLRIYNYLAIYISFFYILRLKTLSARRL